MVNRNIVNIAIVGCGRVFNHYLKIFRDVDLVGYKIVATCDVDIKKAKDASIFFNSKYFSSLEDMLNDLSIDLLIVSTPSGYHYEHTKIAFDFGINVLCEKPITMLPSQAKELLEIADKKKLMYGVSFQNRFNPAIRVLENAIKLGRFGKIVTSTIRLRWCRYQDYYEDGWHGTWLNDGGVINQQAIHHVDVMNWLIGPIKSVCAISENRVNKLEAEDTLVAIVKFQNGALGTIEATTAARPDDIEASLSIIGEKGAVVIGGIALNKIETWNFIDELPEDKNVKEFYSQEVSNGYGLSHKAILQFSINSLLDGSILPPVSAIHALDTTCLIHAIYKSEEIGGWVHLDDKPTSKRLGFDNKIKL